MKTGSLRRSIALPDSTYGAGYSPDGLSESDIDALLAQEGIDIEEPDGDTAPVIPLRTGDQGSPAVPTGGEAA